MPINADLSQRAKTPGTHKCVIHPCWSDIFGTPTAIHFVPVREGGRENLLVQKVKRVI